MITTVAAALSLSRAFGVLAWDEGKGLFCTESLTQLVQRSHLQGARDEQTEQNIQTEGHSV